jgi:hypothetical protein
LAERPQPGGLPDISRGVERQRHPRNTARKRTAPWRLAASFGFGTWRFGLVPP